MRPHQGAWVRSGRLLGMARVGISKGWATTVGVPETHQLVRGDHAMPKVCGQRFCREVQRVERLVRDRRPDAVQPAALVLAPRRHEGRPRQLLCVQPIWAHLSGQSVTGSALLCSGLGNPIAAARQVFSDKRASMTVFDTLHVCH